MNDMQNSLSLADTPASDTKLTRKVDNKLSLNLSNLLKLRYHNKLSFSEIGKMYGVSKQAIHQAIGKLAKLMDRPELLEAYNDHKVEILTAAQLKAIENLIDDERLKKASVNNLAYTIGTLGNEIRLEKGQMTQIIGYMDYNRALEQVIQERSKLQSELGLDDTTSDTFDAEYTDEGT